MLQGVAETSNFTFRTCEEVSAEIQTACAANSDVSIHYNLGASEEGRPIDGVVLGHGVKKVSLIAGAHSDEPVGAETLRAFILNGLTQKEKLKSLFAKYQFIIIPHINPDGEARNQRWIHDWPDLSAYLQHAFREGPGRDLEFGFPNMRIENELVAKFLRQHAPIDLHVSLHGMGFSEGAMLLIERHWIEQTRKLQVQFANIAQRVGLRMHDHDRKGEKGFIYIASGFTTTPEGQAMRAYFNSIDDKQTAKLFHDSSMEFVRKLGGDPLCLVTELPLFIIGKEMNHQPPGVPAAYLSFKNKIPELRAKILQGEAIDNIINEFKIKPLPLSTAIKLQLYTIQLGLETI